MPEGAGGGGADVEAGAEETSASKPPSESQHAPLRDRVVNLNNA